MILQARDICLGYQQHHGYQRVLENFNLSLSSGELVSILGPSGVGKSSLLRVLAGLQMPEKGEVRLFNEAVTEPHPSLAFIFQNPTLLPWLNVHKNVGFGLKFKHQPKISQQVAEGRIATALEDVGLTHATHYYPNELSGGMAQRVALARALARESKIILLDEPFSALDKATRSQMQLLLSELMPKHQTAAILVTHDIDEALLVSQRIILVGEQPGKIIGEWNIPQYSGDEDTILFQLQRERTEILAALYAIKAQGKAEKTIEFFI